MKRPHEVLVQDRFGITVVHYIDKREVSVTKASQTTEGVSNLIKLAKDMSEKFDIEALERAGKEKTREAILNDVRKRCARLLRTAKRLKWNKSEISKIEAFQREIQELLMRQKAKQ